MSSQIRPFVIATIVLGLSLGLGPRLFPPRVSSDSSSALSAAPRHVTDPPLRAREISPGPHPQLSESPKSAPVVSLARLQDPEMDLRDAVVPLKTMRSATYEALATGELLSMTEPSGTVRQFAPGMVLLKLTADNRVGALRVEPRQETAAIEALQQRPEVEFVELNTLRERQFVPNDPLLSKDWRHETLESSQAWQAGLGSKLVYVAIVDTPFQMNHPDLSGNSADGWDIVRDRAITSGQGIDHSTGAAGLVAATINNGIGVSGSVNCRVIPINIIGFIDEMYDAAIWAADQGVRVVNISWDGADSFTLNAAGAYLKTEAAGLLVMPGLNDPKFSDYPAHPHIYAISMTDAADNARSTFGFHIDFAAPGYNVFSTVAGSSYGLLRGTSYSAPVFSGVVAFLFSVNPLLTPEDVEDVLKLTALDKGEPGWDTSFGWGRIAFGEAAREAISRLNQMVAGVAREESTFSIEAIYDDKGVYSLMKSDGLPGGWSSVGESVIVVADNERIILTDPAATNSSAFYQLRIKPQPPALAQ